MPGCELWRKATLPIMRYLQTCIVWTDSALKDAAHGVMFLGEEATDTGNRGTTLGSWQIGTSHIRAKCTLILNGNSMRHTRGKTYMR